LDPTFVDDRRKKGKGIRLFSSFTESHDSSLTLGANVRRSSGTEDEEGSALAACEVGTGARLLYLSRLVLACPSSNSALSQSSCKDSKED